MDVRDEGEKVMYSFIHPNIILDASDTAGTMLVVVS